MPIYEYHCYDCQKEVEIFFRSFTGLETKEVVCSHCKGSNLKRLVSNVMIVNAGKRGAESQATSGKLAQANIDKEDPQTLARTMRRAGRAAGQDLGSEFNEVADRLERGEKASSVEKSLRKRKGESTQTH